MREYTTEACIEKYGTENKDDELTVRIVGNYLNSNSGHISSLDELLMNITTGGNAYKMNYEIVETEYKKHST